MTAAGHARFLKKGYYVKLFSALKLLLFSLMILYLSLFWAGWFLERLSFPNSYPEALQRQKSAFTSLYGNPAFLLPVGIGILFVFLYFFGPRFFRRIPGAPLLFRQGFLILLIFPSAIAHIGTMLLDSAKVEGRSMLPGLHPGDRVWLNKWETGIPLPVLPPFTDISHPPWWLLSGEHATLPPCGQLVAFRYPGLNSVEESFFIKRVLALPGDSYSFENGHFLRNGKVLDEGYLAADGWTGERPDYPGNPVLILPEETRQFGAGFQYAAYRGIGKSGRVPDNTILVLGDNRRQSRDSRSFGFVPLIYVRGVATTFHGKSKDSTLCGSHNDHTNVFGGSVSNRSTESHRQ